MKGCVPYVKHLVDLNSIVFVCEHWLTPGEVSFMVHDEFRTKWCHLKSSIDPTEIRSGRPYGGCGFICNKVDGIVYKPIECTSERISGIDIIAENKRLLSVYGVCLPCDNNRVASNECYLEILNELQGYVDNSDVPCIITGDFNTRLPQASVLPKRWYRGRGFSNRSAVLYDFIAENNMLVANYCFPQSSNHTWRNGVLKSYIDHILLPEWLIDNVTSCEIVPDCDENNSDHLPIRCCLQFERPPRNDAPGNANPCEKRPKMNWDDPQVRDAYSAALAKQLSSLHLVSPSSVLSHDSAIATLNSLASSLVSCMHNAASSCASADQSSAHPTRPRNSWWTSDCTTAKNRMRLFFRIWKSLGRPSQGVAHECYRDARRAYRRVLCSAIGAKRRSNHHLLSQLFYAKNTSHFWNLVKRSRNQRSNGNDIGMTQLSEHFTRKFAAPIETQSDFIQEAHETISLKYSDLAQQRMDHITVSERRVMKMVKRLRKGCSPGIDGISAEHLCYGLGTPLSLHL